MTDANETVQRICDENGLRVRQRLDGGNIHYLYALESGDILKLRMPYVASVQTVPLDPEDVSIEINVLNAVRHVLTPDAGILVPHCRQSCVAEGWFVMSRLDGFDGAPAAAADEQECRALARHLASLHRKMDDASLYDVADDNERGAGFFARYIAHRIGSSDATADLMRRLAVEKMQPVHGDVLLKNVSCADGKMSLIDWEYFHVGSPVFEAGLLAADIAARAETVAQAENIARVFIETYNAGQPDAARLDHGLFGECMTAALRHRSGKEMTVRLAPPPKSAPGPAGGKR